MKKLNNITLGADPELFLIDTSKNAIISAIGKVPGTKNNPYHPSDLDLGYNIQTDNILVEFNIPPVKLQDMNGFVNSLNTMREYIDSFVKNINENFATAAVASGLVDSNELKDPAACIFGCDPDFNCYSNKENPRPILKDPNFRSAGFHIHVGFDEHDNLEKCVAIVKYLDVYLGVPSVMLDQDTERRTLYGKAGCFRFQPWGVEYRVLSSRMLNSPEFVYNQIVKALEAFDNDVVLPSPQIVRATINKSNIKEANKLITKYHIV